MMKKLIIAVLLLFVVLPVSAQTVVQAQSAENAASANTVAIPITTTLGNAIVVACRVSNNTTTMSVSDTSSQTYTAVASGRSVGGTAVGEQMFWFANSAALTQVNCNYNTSQANNAGVVFEISGMATSNLEDASVNATQAGVTTHTSGSLTTTNANDILLFAIGAGGARTAVTAGAGYTIPTNGTSSGGRVDMQYKVVSSTQSGVTTSTSWTTSQTVASTFVGLKAAPSGATPAPNKRMKLEQYDNGAAVLTGFGLQANLDGVNLFLSPCDPVDATCSEYLQVCFADGACHPLKPSDGAATVSLVKTSGTPAKTLTYELATFTALPNSAVP